MLKLGLLAENMRSSVLPGTYARYADALGIELSFDIFNVERSKFAEAVSFLGSTLDGFTVTMPYKTVIPTFCGSLDGSAASCGAVNTVLCSGGRLIGYNTDGWGLIKYLRTMGLELSGKRMIIIGAGGAARSIAYYLSFELPECVYIANQHIERAEAAAARAGAPFHAVPLETGMLDSLAPETDILINASALGQLGHPDFDDLSFIDRLPRSAAVIDINYSNPSSVLLPYCAAKGLQTFSGRAMSIFQGIKAMGIWTGHEPRESTALDILHETEKSLQSTP